MQGWFPGGRGSVDTNALIKSIIFAEAERCKSEEVRSRTPMELWHRVVKPILMRSEGKDITTESWSRLRYQWFLKILLNMINDGEITYGDLSLDKNESIMRGFSLGKDQL